MSQRIVHWLNLKILLGIALILLLVLPAAVKVFGAEEVDLREAIVPLEEFRTPGLEAELSGIYPHPTDSDLYFVLANKTPPYRYGQKPMLPVEYRGQLLTVNRQGKIQAAIPIAEDDFGGMAFGGGYFYIALTNGAEILKVEPETGRTVARFAVPAAAGGLEYDADRGVLIAQLYMGHPHLAVLDVETGAILDTLWSDESTMGLVKVDGDLLCTWASGWDPGSIGELRLLDPRTGKVRARTPLEQVHSVLAPTRDAKGGPAFLSLVTVDSYSGETLIRKYGYRRGERS